MRQFAGEGELLPVFAIGFPERTRGCWLVSLHSFRELHPPRRRLPMAAVADPPQGRVAIVSNRSISIAYHGRSLYGRAEFSNCYQDGSMTLEKVCQLLSITVFTTCLISGADVVAQLNEPTPDPYFKPMPKKPDFSQSLSLIHISEPTRPY